MQILGAAQIRKQVEDAVAKMTITQLKKAASKKSAITQRQAYTRNMAHSRLADIMAPGEYAKFLATLK